MRLKLLTLFILISSASFIYCTCPSRRIKRQSKNDPLNRCNDSVLSSGKTPKFNYKYVFNWDVGDNVTSEPDDIIKKSRVNVGDEKQPVFDKGKIILTYPIEELDPPLDNTQPPVSSRVNANKTTGKIILTYPIEELDPPLDNTQPPVSSRVNANKTTPVTSITTEDSDEISEPATEALGPEPIECAYGTARFPIPEPKVEKGDRRIADIKCEEQMLDIKYNIFDVIKNKRICGISTIIRGEKAVQKQFPHMGAVGWIDTDNQPVFFCGCTLISSKFSVTAAHCRSTPASGRGAMNVISPFPKLVRFGNVDISDTEEIIDVNIDKFLTLPEYDPNKKYLDIALIRFTKDITFSESVRPACLWHRSMDDLTTGNVTGWGETKSRDASSRSNHLMFAEVKIWEHKNCTEEIGESRTNRKWTGLTDEQFCAGNLLDDGDTCGGDSGGPLQIQEPFKQDENITVYHVVGITSFGFTGACGVDKVPGIYTKVNKYLSFIEKHVWPSN